MRWGAPLAPHRFFSKEKRCLVKVAENLFVAIDYRLSLDSGEEVDSSQEGNPLSFVVGAGRIIPGLENALVGKEEGESFKVSLEPENAYGAIDDSLFQEIPRERFPADVEIKPGMAFQATGPRGPIMLTVKEADESAVKVDLNHPMAGKKLHFDVKVVEVREASPEELQSPQGGCACGPEKEKEDCGPGCACG